MTSPIAMAGRRGIKFASKSARQTKALGRRLGRLLEAGDTVYLYGELGSGKTVFVKGVARGLGVPEDEITSASFTIAAEHRGGRCPLYHIDLYRLSGLEEAEAVGIADYIDADGVAVVEWAERLAPPEGGIRVKINVVSKGEREIIIEGLDEKNRNHMQERPSRAG